MTRDEIYDKVKAVLVDALGVDDDEVTPEATLRGDLGAESIDVLVANRHNVTMHFSHVDVEQAIFGLAALVSPFGNHTQPARVTYETNQGRQTGGW